jgi:hypothetical protein
VSSINGLDPGGLAGSTINGGASPADSVSGTTRAVGSPRTRPLSPADLAARSQFLDRAKHRPVHNSKSF